MSDYFERNRLAAVDILQSWGIEPNNVATFGISREGYYEFQRDSFGAKFIANDANEPKLKFHEWPEGFPLDVFFGFVAEMQGAQK